MSSERAEHLRIGTWFGAVTWGVYWVAEVAVFTLRPILLHYQDYVSATHATFLVALALVFLGAGLISGVLGGLLLGAWRRPPLEPPWMPYQAFAAASLATAYVANALWAGFQPANRAAVLAGGAVLAAAGMAVILPSGTGFPRFVVSPWVVSLWLTGAPLLLGARGWKVRSAFLGGLVVAAAGSRLVLDRGRDARACLRRHAFACIVGALAVLGSIGVAAREFPQLPTWAGSQAPDRPHVVVVVLDTVRASHLSLYGYARPTTPFLERLSREATVYTRACSTSNFTLPAHASLFTGLYPRRHGAVVFPPRTGAPRPLDRRFDTLAEILTRRGYRTFASVANRAFVNADYGLSQGFEQFVGLSPVRAVPLTGRHALRFGVRRLLAHILPTQQLDEAYRDGAAITQDALALLDAGRVSGRPIFLFLNYMDAHEPYVIPPAYQRLFPGMSARLTYEDYSRAVTEVVAGRRPLTTEERAHFVSQYDGAIAYLDQQLERLVTHLKEAGLWENTMLVVTSDHGEAFGEHNFLGHSQSLYEHQVRIPLLIRYPGQRHPERVDVPVSLVDLMPTVLAVAGLPTPTGLDGRNLAGADRLEERPVVAEAWTDGELARLRPDFPPAQFAVISGQWKLIASAGAGEELYDLARDPAETENLSAAQDARARLLRNQLTRWIESTPLEVKAHQEADPKAIERLRNFGYIR